MTLSFQCSPPDPALFVVFLSCVYILPCNEAISFFSVTIHCHSWQQSLNLWPYAFSSECRPPHVLVTQEPHSPAWHAHFGAQVQPRALRCSCPTWPGHGDYHLKFLYREAGFVDCVQICYALWVVGKDSCLLFTLDGKALAAPACGRKPT